MRKIIAISERPTRLAISEDATDAKIDRIQNEVASRLRPNSFFKYMIQIPGFGR